MTLLPRLSVLFASTLLFACNSATDESANATVQHAVQITAFSLPTHIEVDAAIFEQAEQALLSAVADLHYVAEISHPWQPGALGRTNELLGLAAEFSANPSGLPLIRQATELYRQSEGYFNPAMGHLQRLWGFHQDDLDFVLPASSEEVEMLLAAAPRMTDIRIEGIRVASGNPQLRLDYGHFAAGYGLDIARLRLREAGILQARLRTPNANVLLGKPSQPSILEHYPTLTLTLQQDESIYTVSVDDRHYTMDKENIHIHLNPFTGQPVRGIRHLSVIHPESAASAAAQAQALLLAGEDKLPSLAQRMGVDYYLFQKDDGRYIASPGLQARLVNPQAVHLLAPDL